MNQTIGPAPDNRPQIQRLRRLIAEIHYCCRNRLAEEARRFELTPAEVRCLLLFERHRYITGLEVADLLEVAKSRATVIIDGLEVKDLVKRLPDPTDARVKLVCLTPAGQQKMRELDEFILGLHGRLMEQIDPAQRPMVLAALEILHISMETMKRQLAAGG
ncbi:MAG: MarR family transcriptional regulator [Thermodesulfobacteriota bacterium]